MNYKKIVIADDDPTILIHTAETLEDEGYETLRAVNGKYLLSAVEDNKPDLILLDWNMPVLDGLETLKILKSNQNTANIPVIMITGFMTLPENLKTALEAGAIDFIRKPFEKIELIARIQSVLKMVEYLQQTVALKDRELALSAISLAQNTELSTMLISKLNMLKQLIKGDIEHLTIINDLISDVSKNQQNFNWDNFVSQFTLIYPNHINGILKVHPELTPSEIKLCTLLRLNISTKDIANITNLTYDSIRVFRTRLRKKLDLENEDGLVAYLMQF